MRLHSDLCIVLVYMMNPESDFSGAVCSHWAPWAQAGVHETGFAHVQQLPLVTTSAAHGSNAIPEPLLLPDCSPDS